MIDRSEVNRALAKAKQCGKDAMAAAWAAILINQLECADILQIAYQRDAHRLIEMAQAD
jgi:hypothetical protein